MIDSQGSTDDRTICRARDGDLRAQEELLEMHREQLRRMIAIRLDRRLAARTDPSDIVQDVMQDAHKRLSEYFANPQIPFYPWLRRIAEDRLADAYRRHIGAGRRSVLKEHSRAADINDESAIELSRNIVASSVNPGRRIMLAEMHARTKTALMELKPADREILVLRYLEQLSVQEIASVLDITQTAVTSRHLRALQRLRQLLGDEFGA